MKVDAILREKAQRIVTVGMTTTVERAARLFKTEHIGALVVKDTCGTEGDVILGMLSEADIVHAIADHGPAVLRMPVSRVMSRLFVPCHPEDEADTVAGLMETHRIGYVPVLDGGALVGVLGLRDLLGQRDVRMAC